MIGGARDVEWGPAVERGPVVIQTEMDLLLLGRNIVDLRGSPGISVCFC